MRCPLRRVKLVANRPVREGKAFKGAGTIFPRGIPKNSHVWSVLIQVSKGIAALARSSLSFPRIVARLLCSKAPPRDPLTPVEEDLRLLRRLEGVSA